MALVSRVDAFASLTPGRFHPLASSRHRVTRECIDYMRAGENDTSVPLPKQTSNAGRRGASERIVDAYISINTVSVDDPEDACDRREAGARRRHSCRESTRTRGSPRRT